MEAIYFDRFKQLRDAIKIISMNNANGLLCDATKEALLNDYKEEAEKLIRYIDLELDIAYN